MQKVKMTFSPKIGLPAFGDYHFLLSIGVKNEDWGVIILDKIPIKTTLPEQ